MISRLRTHRVWPTGVEPSKMELTGIGGRRIRAASLDFDFLLSDPHDFFQRGMALNDSLSPFLLQRHHALGDRRLFDGGGVGFASDESSDLIVQHHEFKNTGTASIAGLGTGRTAGSSIEGGVGTGRDVQATEFFLARTIGALAVRTDPPQQSLGENGDDR